MPIIYKPVCALVETVLDARFSKKLKDLNLVEAFDSILIDLESWDATFNSDTILRNEEFSKVEIIFVLRRSLADTRSGILHFYLSLISLYRKAGFTCTLLAQSNSNFTERIKKDFRVVGIDIKKSQKSELISIGIGRAKWLSEVQSFIQNSQSNIIVAPNADLDFLALQEIEASDTVGKILTLHTDWITDPRSATGYRKLRKLLAQSLFNSLSFKGLTIIGNTKANSDLFTSHLTTKAEMLAIRNVHHVPITGLNYDCQKNNLVLFIGRFDSRKNPLVLADAWHKIDSANQGWKLVFIGNGGPLLKKLVNKTKNDQSIEIIINASEDLKRRLLAESKLVVIPSEYESFGYVMVEAWASKSVVLHRSTQALNEVAETNTCMINFQNDADLPEKLGKSLNEISSLLNETNNYSYLSNLKNFQNSWLEITKEIVNK